MVMQTGRNSASLQLILAITVNADCNEFKNELMVS